MADLTFDFERSFAHTICSLSHAMERALNAELDRHGITIRQAQVLGCLVRDPGMTQAAMARRMRVEPPTLAGVLSRMERDAWVKRTPDPVDRRCKRVELRAPVRPVWRKIVRCVQRVERQALHGVSPTRVRSAQRVLNQVLKNLACEESVS